ncbi:MAG: NapH/MauN family ferredoxin-type protein [Coriobacteriales bacterium]|nr:NapH/MauN family ferredoxin-type protein [Coriobacteriales bacterium]
MSSRPKTSKSDPSLPAPSRQRWRIARRCVQVSSIVLFALPILLAGWTLLGGTVGGANPLATPAELPFFPFYGTLSSSELVGINLTDPFATLQVVFASKTFMLEWLWYALPILLLYALIRGRVFCGWVCPVNFLLEGVDFLRTKLKLQVKERVVPRRIKIYVAAGILLVSALVSIPIFEVFTPIGAISRGIVLGSTTGLGVLIAIVFVELFWGHRVWCRSLCPLGGFYQVLGRVGLINIRMDYDRCTHCGNCSEKCLTDPEILDPVLEGVETTVLAGDCMLCGECIDVCPTKALSAKLGFEHFKPSNAAKASKAAKPAAKDTTKK